METRELVQNEMVKNSEEFMGTVETKIKDIDIEAIGNLSEEDVDNIFDNDQFNASVEEILKDSTSTSLEFKIDYLKFLKANMDIEQKVEEMKLGISKIDSEFKVEMEKLISNLDYADSLVKLTQAIAETEDKEEKARLQVAHDSLYAALHLDKIKNTIMNKGLKQIEKECKRDFDKVVNKSFKILNRSEQLFIDITRMESMLNRLFVDSEREVKIIVYMIARAICKDKKLGSTTALFVNHFMLNVVRLNNHVKSGQFDDSMNTFRNALIELIVFLK